MAKAKKLPSGNWRIRVGVNGKVKSFTAPTKKEAEIMAAEFLCNAEKNPVQKTVSECVDEYIEMKLNLLSPTTISGYRKIKRNDFADIDHIRLCDLNQTVLQRWINALSLNKSPKTVHNAFGLLSAVLTVYVPEKRFVVTLPKKQKAFREFPEIKTIVDAFKGSEIELPVLLALWMGMRMSEIRGAKKSNIKNGVLTIKSVIVTVDGLDIEKKQTKTYDSARKLRLPRYILDLIAELPDEQEYLTTLSGQAIYKRFSRRLEEAGIPHIRFHDLRHLNASAMLSLGVPDRYAMERGGWSSPVIMKGVYQHTFSSEREKVDDLVDSFFNDFLLTDTD